MAMKTSNMASSLEDRKGNRPPFDGASCGRRWTGRRSGGITSWTSLAVVVIALVRSATGKVVASGPEEYSVRAIDSCPRLGFFLEWVLPPNALESEGVCLLCVCKDDSSALCWKRDQRRCEQGDQRQVRRSKRVRRSSLLGSLLKPTIMERNKHKFKTGPCQPYHGSYSVGCPPDDWCVGCTVCDCSAEGRWDCHLLSFCGDKNKKQKQIMKKVSPKHKVRNSNMKNLINAVKRQTTKKPKVVKRKAPIITTKKPVYKPKANPKPKPRRSIKQQPNVPESILGRNDSALAQEVVKRVMAAIQEMTHRKYGIRPELRRMLTMTTKKPNLKFKKITKKPFKPKKPPPKAKPKPTPKPQPKKQMKKSTTKLASKQTITSTSKPQIKQIVQKNIPRFTTIKRRPHEKMLEEELKKIIAKAALKIHKQPVRSKRELTNDYTTGINEIAPSLTMTTIVASNATQNNSVPTSAIYETKDYNLPSGNGQDNFYEYSTLDDKANNVQGIEKEDYYKYSIAATAEIIDTTEVNKAYTINNKDTKNHFDMKYLPSKYATNEIKKVWLPSVSDQADVGEMFYPNITEGYSDHNDMKSKVTEKESVVVLKIEDPTSPQAMLKVDKLTKKPLAISTKTYYAINHDLAGSFKTTKNPENETNKKPDKKHLQKVNASNETKNNYGSNDQTNIPKIDVFKITEKYPHIGSKLIDKVSTVLPKNVDSTTTEVMLNKEDKENNNQRDDAEIFISKITKNYPHIGSKFIENASTVVSEKVDSKTIEVILDKEAKVNNNRPDDPKIFVSKITENYPHIESKLIEKVSITLPENSDSTTTETILNKVTKKLLDTSIKIQYVSNNVNDFVNFKPTNNPYMLVKVIDKRFDNISELYNASYDGNNLKVHTNISNKIMQLTNKSFDMVSKKHNNIKNKNNISITKIMPIVLKHKLDNNYSMSGFQNLLKDLGLRLTVTKQVYTKVPATNFSVQNYFRRLFRYIFSKTKEERKNLRKNLLEKEKFNKLEIINAVCQNVGPCNMTRTKKLLMKPLLKELSTETNKIFKTIKIVKGLLHLLDMPHENNDIKINETDQLKTDMAKLNSIVKGTYEKKVTGQLTETEMTQINFIKNNTDIFISSVGNFASTLNKLIEILTSDIRRKGKHRHTRADADSEKQKVQTVFKRIKAVLNEHDMAENSLIEALYHNLTKKDRNDILHLIYRNSDIMDNYKFRLLEILGKLKGVLSRIENIKAERRYRAMLEAEKQAEEKKKSDKIHELELKKKLEKASKKKQKLDKKRKEMEGIAIWNMGRPDRRRKRQLGEEGVYEYLLMIMEFLLKQTYLTYTAPPVDDGIDILVRAIQDAPDIEPMPRSRPIVSHSLKKTNSFKKLIPKKPYAITPTRRNNIINYAVVKPVTEKKNNLDDVDVKNGVTKKPYKENESVKNVANAEGDSFHIPHYEPEDNDDDDNDDEYEHRYERQLNVTKLKKASEKLVQFTAEDPITTNLEKIMEKMVYKRVSLASKNDSNKVDTDYLNEKYVDRPKEAVTTNAVFESGEDTITRTTTEPTIDPPIPPPTLRESSSSELHDTKVKSSHKIRQHDEEEHPKLVWISNAPEEENARVEKYPVTTSTSTTSTMGTTSISTPATEKRTTERQITSSIPVTQSSTDLPSRKIKRNTSSPELILRRKEIDLLQSLDYITSDRYPPASREETVEEY